MTEASFSLLAPSRRKGKPLSEKNKATESASKRAPSLPERWAELSGIRKNTAKGVCFGRGKIRMPFHTLTKTPVNPAAILSNRKALTDHPESC